MILVQCFVKLFVTKLATQTIHMLRQVTPVLGIYMSNYFPFNPKHASKHFLGIFFFKLVVNYLFYRNTKQSKSILSHLQAYFNFSPVLRHELLQPATQDRNVSPSLCPQPCLCPPPPPHPPLYPLHTPV